jgi:hypothetical protein
MARGIQVPLAVNNGRLRKLTGDDYIDQLIRVALKGMDSDNPFQTVGLGEWMIFGINDGMDTGEIKQRVVAIFASLKADQLAQLKDPDDDLVFTTRGEELWLDLTYVNMETQERMELSVPIPGE